MLSYSYDNNGNRLRIETKGGASQDLYAYCANNPVLYEDPTGNYRNCVKDAFDRIRQDNLSIPPDSKVEGRVALDMLEGICLENSWVGVVTTREI